MRVILCLIFGKKTLRFVATTFGQTLLHGLCVAHYGSRGVSHGFIFKLLKYLFTGNGGNDVTGVADDLAIANDVAKLVINVVNATSDSS